jgi:hypothetical protein
MLGSFIVIKHGKSGGAFGTESSGHTRIVWVAFDPFYDTIFGVDFDRAPDRAHAADTEYRFFHDRIFPPRVIQIFGCLSAITKNI